jgi:hypothetical protein
MLKYVMVAASMLGLFGCSEPPKDLEQERLVLYTEATVIVSETLQQVKVDERENAGRFVWSAAVLSLSIVNGPDETDLAGMENILSFVSPFTVVDGTDTVYPKLRDLFFKYADEFQTPTGYIGKENTSRLRSILEGVANGAEGSRAAR